MNSQRDNLIGEASCFLEVIEQVSQLAPLDKPILIVGERGTGKELFASRLHYLSSRWEQPLITLNCAAINENLLESELFGHESGAFTGASRKHQGRFELANNGTLFLDELGNSSLSVQEKLLRAIEYGEFERVGGNKTVKVDVRLVAATNENLPEMVQRGKFRADLLDRLAFDVVTLPPLRARTTDIPILSQHFGLAMTRELGRDYFAGFSQRAEQALLDYPWPGNVRELKNVIERNIYKSSPEQVIDSIQFDPFISPYQPGSTKLIRETKEPRQPFADSTSIPDLDTTSTDNNELNLDNHHLWQSKLSASMSPALQRLFSEEFPLDFKQSITELEIHLLQKALKITHFNQKKCAEILGLTYHQLRGYLKKYQLLDQK